MWTSNSANYIRELYAITSAVKKVEKVPPRFSLHYSNEPQDPEKSTRAGHLDPKATTLLVQAIGFQVFHNI